MSITDWFKAREEKRYTRLGAQSSSDSDVPDGVWLKCDSCKHIIYEGELAENLRVCKHCGFHMKLTAFDRIEMLVDEGSFVELDAGLTSGDPLEFGEPKPYPASLDKARESSGLPEAFVYGTAAIDEHPVVLGAMDFRFIGASMGSVVGEKVTRAFEYATHERLPVVLATASGGARMQEGMLSLMQMAKTAAAARRFGDAGLVYISILTNPTYGGVTACFATVADVIVAEPGALIGFAGPLVIEQTIREKPPKGFQTAESLLQHGMIDEVVPRLELRDSIALLLDYLDRRASEPRGPASGSGGGA